MSMSAVGRCLEGCEVMARTDARCFVTMCRQTVSCDVVLYNRLTDHVHLFATRDLGTLTANIHVVNVSGVFLSHTGQGVLSALLCPATVGQVLFPWLLCLAHDNLPIHFLDVGDESVATSLLQPSCTRVRWQVMELTCSQGCKWRYSSQRHMVVTTGLRLSLLGQQ